MARRRSRDWEPEEDEIIYTHYPVGGAAGCAKRLSGRSLNSIACRAHRLGLRHQDQGASYDHRALARALGMDRGVPASLAILPAHVHRIIEDAQREAW